MGLALYLAAALLLVAGHGVPSAPSLRPRLIARFGRRGFLTAYSVASFLLLGLFVLAYVHLAPATPIYRPVTVAPVIALVLTPIAFVLVALRLATAYGEPHAPSPPFGIYRICRFPGSIGILIWALAHLQAVGDLRRIVLFTTMSAIALVALVKNERLRRNLARAGTPAHLETTSLVPFAAILTGRQRLVIDEIGTAPVMLALVAWLILLGLHAHVFGVDPLAHWR